MTRDTEAIIEAADNFADMLAKGWDLMDDTFGSLRCEEAEALAALVRATGDDFVADRIIEGHAASDQEGDLHYEEAS